MPRYSFKDPTSGKIVSLVGDSPPTEAELNQIFAQINGQAPPKAKTSLTDILSNLLPMVGGGVGGVVGGPIGATVGGAAGQGFKDIAQNASELPGAVADVARNLVAQPRATLEGLVGGAGTGTKDAAIQGAEQGALEGAGRLVGRYVLQPAATAVMRGYLKPSLASASIGDARQIVQTALDEALPVTKGGEARAGRLIAELNQTINDTLSKVKGTVNLQDVANKVRAFARAKYFTPGVDPADYKAAMDVADAIDQHASMAVQRSVPVTRTVTSPIVDASGQPITSEVAGTTAVTDYPAEVSATKANRIKQDVRPPSRSYGQQSYQPETVTRKVAGSKMRQAIENVATAEGHPEIAALNARESRLIDAQDAIQRATGREENKSGDLRAMPWLIAGGIGLEEGYRKDPAAGLAWTLATRALLSPAIATRAAYMAYRLARNGYSVSNAARAAIALAQTAGSPAQ